MTNSPLPDDDDKRDEPALFAVPQSPVQFTPASEREPRLQLERVGDYLKRIREERGDDLQQIADYLCIRRSFLMALEGSRYEEFPADAYVIGFLRSYAAYLGIDAKEAIDRYRNEMAGRRKKPVLLVPTPITEGRTPSTVIMVAAAVVALIIYVLWYGLSASDRTAVSTPPSLPSTASTETPEPSSSSSDAPNLLASPIFGSGDGPQLSSATSLTAPVQPSAPTSAAAPASVTTSPSTTGVPAADAAAPVAPPTEDKGQVFGSARGSRVTVRADQSSWISITDSDGKVLFDRVLKPGDVYKVPDIDGVLLSTGNSNGLIISLDGTDLPRLSRGSTRVLHDLPIGADHVRDLPSASSD